MAIYNSDQAVRDLKDTHALPMAQRSVDALARWTDQAADFALRESDLRQVLSDLRPDRSHTQQRLGEAGRYGHEVYFSHLFINLPQALAQNAKESGPGIRMLPEERQHITSVQDRETALACCPRVNRALLSKEHVNLPEDFSCNEDPEHDFLPSTDARLMRT